MSKASPHPIADSRPRGDRLLDRYGGWLAATVLALAVSLSYGNSLRGELVFDGQFDILRNASIRHLWPPLDALLNRGGKLPARPVAYYTFAINYALHGGDPLGYHLVNLAVHLGAGLLLFGIVQRTMRSPRLVEEWGTAAFGVALAVALLWCVHPLQTQAVTYVYQRIESLMGFFFLASLYAFVCSTASDRPRVWLSLSVVACALGMGTKEVMIAAPLLIAWYDRVFVAASVREMLRKRWLYYAALGATYGILAAILFAQRGRFPEFDKPAATPLEYAFTQPGVIVHYLRLAFWPAGQCADYGWPIAKTFVAIVPPLVLILCLLAAAAWAVVRAPALGFLGGWFFLILAPTSSALPILDVANEHRMYLPLAAVITAVVLAAVWTGKRLAARDPASRAKLLAAGAAALVLVAVALAATTFARNRVYEDSHVFWADANLKAPDYWRPYNGLGADYLRRGDPQTAERYLREALQRLPGRYMTLFNLGLALHLQGRDAESETYFREAEKVEAGDPDLYGQLGLVLSALGRKDEAAKAYDKALSIDPKNAWVLTNYGLWHLENGHLEKALAQLNAATASNPKIGQAWDNLGQVYVRMQRNDEAIQCFRQAIALEPLSWMHYFNLSCLLVSRDPAEAERVLRRALELQPDASAAHNSLGVLLEKRSPREALFHYQEAVKCDAQNTVARENFDRLLSALKNRPLAESRP